MTVKFPDVVVDLGDLSGPAGNAFAVLGNVQGAMKRAGLSKAEIDAYMDEAKSGDYDHLLKTTVETVTVVKCGRNPKCGHSDCAPYEIVDSADDLFDEDDLYDDSDWDRD